MTRVADTRGALREARGTLTGSVAVVLTMGALHEGHRALIRAARDDADAVLVTVFVNPLQFGAGEDLGRYPRTLDEDIALCDDEGVAVVFAPDQGEMYAPGGPAVTVHAGPLGDRLEGASRPGHFDGVLTVVAKLFHLTRPDIAVFGEKDAQQLALVRSMVRDLDLDVQVVGVPTVRESDGLALSSRNRYLSDGQRGDAVALSRALRAGAAAADQGVDAVLAAARAALNSAAGVDVDYLELVDDETWQHADRRTARGRLLVAARLGATRLIDNVPVHLGTRTASSGATG